MVHCQEVNNPGDPRRTEGSGEFHMAGERTSYRKSRLLLRPAAAGEEEEDHAAQKAPNLKRRRHDKCVKMIRLRLGIPRVKKRRFPVDDSEDGELGTAEVADGTDGI